KPMVADKQPGDVVLELDLDPYERSFRHTSTHLMMPAINEAEIWQALDAGRAYVAFDWLGDPTGFRYAAFQGETQFPLGSQVAWNAEQPLQLRAAAPLPGLLKLVRNGEVIQEVRGRALQHEVSEPGVYRLEVWLLVAEELRPWILSNPIYIGPPSE